MYMSQNESRGKVKVRMSHFVTESVDGGQEGERGRRTRGRTRRAPEQDRWGKMEAKERWTQTELGVSQDGGGEPGQWKARESLREALRGRLRE